MATAASRPSSRTRLRLAVIGLIVLALVAGVLYLGLVPIPAPTEPMAIEVPRETMLQHD